MTTTPNDPRESPSEAGIIAASGPLVSGSATASTPQPMTAPGRGSWEVTATPGRFGLSGGSYRDPRFAARRRTSGHTGQER